MGMYRLLPEVETSAEYKTLTVNEFSSSVRFPVGPHIRIPELILLDLQFERA